MTPRDNDKCPIDYGLEIFGDRWTLLILRDMIFRGKRRFSEFTQSAERISTNILSTRLARLEDAGLVEKQYPVTGGHPVYVLTREGTEIIPVILEVIVFSAAHGGYPDGGHGILHGAPPDLIERFKSDRQTLVDELCDTALA